IVSGRVAVGDSIVCIHRDGRRERAAVTALFTYAGLEQMEIKHATAGDIVGLTGFEEVYIGETLIDREERVPLQFVDIDPPTIDRQRSRRGRRFDRLHSSRWSPGTCCCHGAFYICGIGADGNKARDRRRHRWPHWFRGSLHRRNSYRPRRTCAASVRGYRSSDDRSSAVASRSAIRSSAFIAMVAGNVLLSRRFLHMRDWSRWK